MEAFKPRLKIKYLLYKLGIINTNPDYEKIDFMLTLNIYPYSDKIINNNITTINNMNIIEYNNKLKFILSHDMFNAKYESMETLNTTNVTLGIWCSDNQISLSKPEDIILEFFINSLALIKLDLELRKNTFNGLCLFNLKKINPYIINIRNIVTDILNSL